MKKLEAIEKILVECDPVKLIKMGAPENEYSSEALTIYERINRYTSVDQMQIIIYNVFLESFGPKKETAERLIGTFDSYREIAERVKAIIGDKIDVTP
jgi:hypothetical protein